MNYYEVNFDGLIGPSHNYGGLSFGNLASSKNSHAISYPKAAALQGLEKMQMLRDLGYKQAFFPPQMRPDLNVLRRLGFSGNDTQIINRVAKKNPELLPLVYSASAMWAANAATVTPSPDSADGKVHFTPANLVTMFHRSIEHPHTFDILKRVFANEEYFSVHQALPAHQHFSDEGAANHTRFCCTYGSQGLGTFVYGFDPTSNIKTRKFPARQSLEASKSIARQHGVESKSVFWQQNLAAIDAGAFHNDVVAVGNGPLLFHHEVAYEQELLKQYVKDAKQWVDLKTLEVPQAIVSVEDAITSYLFNSQLLAQPDGAMDAMRLIAPSECKENIHVEKYLNALVEDSSQPIRDVHYVDVRQSMSNGGGPACLRLRVVLNEKELSAMHPEFLLDHRKITLLQDWVSKHYRDELRVEDLSDPEFMRECFYALEELTRELTLGNFYPFQQ